VPVGFISVVNGSQEVVYNKIRYFSSQPVANCEIGPKMDPCKNSAQGRLFFRVRNSVEGTLHARHDHGRMTFIPGGFKLSCETRQTAQIAPK